MLTAIDFKQWAEFSSYRFETLKALKNELETIVTFKGKVDRLEELGLNPFECYTAPSQEGYLKFDKDTVVYDTQNIPVWLTTEGKVIEVIKLHLDPSNKAERSIFNQWWFEFFRKGLLKQDRFVRHRRNKGYNEKMPYDLSVVSLEARRRILLRKIQCSVDKCRLLEFEQVDVMTQIDRLDNKLRIYAKTAEAIQVNQKDWSVFTHDDFPMAHKLIAHVWDLVAYYLFLRTYQLPHLEYEVKPLADVFIKKSKTFSTSYKWLDHLDEDLPKLHRSMIAAELIDNQTKIEDLEAVFSAKELGSFQPVRWKESATGLIFFIRSLMPELVADERKRMNYQRIRGCFVKLDGNEFVEDFRTLNQRVDIELSQQKQNKIKSLLYQFQ